MRYNYFNKEKIQDLYIHDCVTEGYHYDYYKKQVSFSCKSFWKGDPKEVHCIFNDVICCNMQSCKFWCTNGMNILGIYFEDDSEQIESFIQLQNKICQKRTFTYETPAYLKGEYVSYRNKVYLPLIMEFNSGDTLLIICESFDWFEKRLEV